MSLAHRHFLKDREAKLTVENLREKFPYIAESFWDDRRIEVANLATGHQVILLDEKPAFIKIEKDLLPTLINTKILLFMPTITVDAGAIPHICNGSSLMAPGIVRIHDSFSKDDLVAVSEVTYDKRIAIVRALVDSNTMITLKRGKVAENLHFVGDKLWDAYKYFG